MAVQASLGVKRICGVNSYFCAMNILNFVVGKSAAILVVLIMMAPHTVAAQDEVNHALCECALEVVHDPEVYPDSVVFDCRVLIREYLSLYVVSADTSAQNIEREQAIRAIMEMCFDDYQHVLEDEDSESSGKSNRLWIKLVAVLLVLAMVPIMVSVMNGKLGKKNKQINAALAHIREMSVEDFPAKTLIDTYQLKMPTGLLERAKSGRKQLQIDLYTTAISYTFGEDSATLLFKDVVSAEFEMVKDGKLMDMYLSMEFDPAHVALNAEDEALGQQLISWLVRLKTRKSNTRLRGEKLTNFVDDFQEALKALAGIE